MLTFTEQFVYEYIYYAAVMEAAAQTWYSSVQSVYKPIMVNYTPFIKHGYTLYAHKPVAEA